MESRKPLGRGVEEISHFFISSATSPESSTAQLEDGRRVSTDEGNHRVIAVLSRTPDRTPLFWAVQLALVLAQPGRRVLVVDTGTPDRDLEAALGTPVIYPTLGDLLDQPKKAPSVQGPGGVRFLAFRLQLDELRRYQSEEGEILFEILGKEEQRSSFVLVGLSMDQAREDLEVYLRLFREAVLVVPSRDLPGTYGILKTLFCVRPELRVGLLEHLDQAEREPTGARRLAAACEEFLKIRPFVVGGIRLDPAVGRIPAENQRVSMDPSMVEIGKGILRELNVVEAQSLFFSRLQAQLMNQRLDKGRLSS